MTKHKQTCLSYCTVFAQERVPNVAIAEVKRRKRHLAIDALGLPGKCQIIAADVQDRVALN